MKPANNVSAKDRKFFSVAQMFRLKQILEIRNFQTQDRRECKSFPLMAGFRYAQVPFKTGFTVLTITFYRS